MRRNVAVCLGAAMLGLALSALAGAQGGATDVSPADSLVAAARQDHTLLDLLQRGGPVMYPLYACSVVLVAFGIERAVSLRRRKIIPPEVEAKIRAAVADGQTAAERQRLLDDIQAHDSPIGRIVKAGFRRANRPVLELEKAIEDAGAKEVGRMQRNNKALSSVASIAPLLGLLGTVTGIMRAFMTVAASADSLGRTEVLAAGIYEALVATAVGIGIAVPAMALYFFFQDRVERLVGEVDEVAGEIVEKLAPRL